MRIRGIKKIILLVSSICLSLFLFYHRTSSASRDVTVSWRACVQHANNLLEEERENFQANVKAEIDSRVQRELADILEKRATQLPNASPKSPEKLTVKQPQPIQRDAPHNEKTYSDDVIKILRRSSQTEEYGQIRGRDPFIVDGYVRNCITGQPLWRTDKRLSYGAISLMEPDKSDEEDPEKRKSSFDEIYRNRQWGGEWDSKANRGLSLSGRGSSLLWSQDMSATLHTLILLLKMRLNKTRISVLDLPCGDMNWMERFLLTRDDIDYTGIDIVSDLIDRHRKRYHPMPWRFLNLDIVNSPLPRAYDLIISRMLLQHLYLPDAVQALKHFSDSGSKYILVTTFPREPRNIELFIHKNNPGRFRPLNLELPPISLSPPLCLQRDGIKDDMGGWDHFIGLWTLPLKQDLACRRSKEAFYPSTDFSVYSCADIHNI